MSSKGKLTAVIKQRELAEKNAIREKSRVSGILEQRKAELEELINCRSLLEKQCGDLETTLRRKALISGDTAALLGSQQLLAVKKSEILELDEKIIEQKKATARAQERLEGSNQEVIDARMEKKKVETIVKNREVIKQIESQVQDQQELEDRLGTKK